MKIEDVQDKKPLWWKPAIDGGAGGCVCCSGTVDKLPMRTRLYQGFGGWAIKKNGELFWMGDSNKEFDEYPTLIKFEKLARKETSAEWVAELDLPLRSAKYQRHGDNTWVLIDKGEGFA